MSSSHRGGRSWTAAHDQGERDERDESETETERTGCVLVARCRPKRVHTACTPLPLVCAIVAAGRFPAAIGWQNRDGGEICESPPVTHACVALQQVATSITEDAGGQLASITHPGARPSTVPAVRKHYLIPDVCHYSCIMNQHHRSSLITTLKTVHAILEELVSQQQHTHHPSCYPANAPFGMTPSNPAPPS